MKTNELVTLTGLKKLIIKYVNLHNVGRIYYIYQMYLNYGGKMKLWEITKGKYTYKGEYIPITSKYHKYYKGDK